MSEHKNRVVEIDDTEDRMGSMHELDFDERRDERKGRIGDERSAAEVEKEFPAEREALAGMSGGEALTDSVHEDNVTMDDLSPETLIDESGEYSPGDHGVVGPADKELSVVDGSRIGGGIGLDEAELARSAPLDGKPWTDQVSPPSADEEP